MMGFARLKGCYFLLFAVLLAMLLSLCLFAAPEANVGSIVVPITSQNEFGETVTLPMLHIDDTITGAMFFKTVTAAVSVGRGEIHYEVYLERENLVSLLVKRKTGATYANYSFLFDIRNKEVLSYNDLFSVPQDKTPTVFVLTEKGIVDVIAGTSTAYDALPGIRNEILHAIEPVFAPTTGFSLQSVTLQNTQYPQLVGVAGTVKQDYLNYRIAARAEELTSSKTKAITYTVPYNEDGVVSILFQGADLIDGKDAAIYASLTVDVKNGRILPLYEIVDPVVFLTEEYKSLSGALVPTDVYYESRDGKIFAVLSRPDDTGMQYQTFSRPITDFTSIALPKTEGLSESAHRGFVPSRISIDGMLRPYDERDLVFTGGKVYVSLSKLISGISVSTSDLQRQQQLIMRKLRLLTQTEHKLIGSKTMVALGALDEGGFTYRFSKDMLEIVST